MVVKGCAKRGLLAAQLAAMLVLEFNRAQTGLAIDDNVLGKCITHDFEGFTGHPLNTQYATLLKLDVKSSFGLFTIVMDEVSTECLAGDFVVSVGLEVTDLDCDNG